MSIDETVIFQKRNEKTKKSCKLSIKTSQRPILQFDVSIVKLL